MKRNSVTPLEQKELSLKDSLELITKVELVCTEEDDKDVFTIYAQDKEGAWYAYFTYRVRHIKKFKCLNTAWREIKDVFTKQREITIVRSK